MVSDERTISHLNISDYRSGTIRIVCKFRVVCLKRLNKSKMCFKKLQPRLPVCTFLDSLVLKKETSEIESHEFQVMFRSIKIQFLSKWHKTINL